MPKIIYCSRTHSQLAQVQRECKNLAFKPRTVLVASRDHLCVNASINVNKGFALNAACQASKKGINPCSYYKNLENGKTHMSWDPMDIEEIHTLAKKWTYCPYYTTKDRVAGADLIFMPYNYLIDEKIRENFELNYNNSIIIFDEAHNVAPSSEEVTSFEVKSGYLDKCVLELKSLHETKSTNDDKEYKTNDD